MSDTVKIPRPKFVRRKGGPTGRTEHDERGNAIWVRTRASDGGGAPSVPDLSLVDEPPFGPAGVASRSPSPPKPAPPKSATPKGAPAKGASLKGGRKSR